MHWGCRRGSGGSPNAYFGYLWARSCMVLSYLRYLWGIFWRLWVFFGYLRARARSGGPGPAPRHLFPGLFFGYPAPPGPDLFFGYLWAIFDFLRVPGALLGSAHRNAQHRNTGNRTSAFCLVLPKSDELVENPK